MINIVQIRNVSPNKKFGGIRTHCDKLCNLFLSDKNIAIQNIVDLPTRTLPIIKKRIFKSLSLFKYLNSDEIDVVHIHGFATFDVPQTILMAKLLKKKIVYSPHFHPFVYLQNPNLGKLFFYFILKPLLRYVSAIITITNTDTAFFERHHNNVFQIPHQFEPTTIRVIEKTSKKKNMILFVGRNEPNKGIKHLYKLPAKYEVHCVTKGKLDRDDFLIHSDISNDELSGLYDEAALVIIPSRYEAFSYVALEAFSHSTPVLMSDRVKIADYLHDCKGCEVFSYENYDDFLDKVEKMIGVDVDKKKILSRFDKNMVRENYQKIYFNVIKNA